MKELFQTLKKDMMISGIFQMLIGILLVIFSDKFLSMICSIAGGCLAGYGVYHMVKYIRGKNDMANNSYDMAQGILGIAAGIFVWVAAEFMISLVFIIFGLFIIFESVLKMQDALDVRKLGHSSWIVMAVIAILMAAAGVMIVAKPTGIVDIIVNFTGIVMIVNGASNLIAKALCKK